MTDLARSTLIWCAIPWAALAVPCVCIVGARRLRLVSDHMAGVLALATMTTNAAALVVLIAVGVVPMSAAQWATVGAIALGLGCVWLLVELVGERIAGVVLWLGLLGAMWAALLAVGL